MDSLLGGRPEHRRVFSSNPGLYPLDVSRRSLQLSQPNMFPDMAQCPLGSKLPRLRTLFHRVTVSSPQLIQYEASRVTQKDTADPGVGPADKSLLGTLPPRESGRPLQAAEDPMAGARGMSASWTGHQAPNMCLTKAGRPVEASSGRTEYEAAAPFLPTGPPEGGCEV